MMTRQQIDSNERAQQTAEGGSDARLIERFTETRVQRERRMARKRIDAATADAIKRAFAL
jgi:hypothetical protein